MDTVPELIKRLRRQTIVPRIAYYCFNETLVTDYEYDRREKELRKLCAEYPDIAKEVEYWDICPSHCVGSSDINDYPINLVRITQDLIAYERSRNGY